MTGDRAGHTPPGELELVRHPSLDERFDPAVRIVDHDPGWSPRALDERARIKAALGGLAVSVDHMGSTAVPGLAAKPVLDLLVGVTALDPRSRFITPLEGLGYLFVPNPHSPDFHFFARPHGRPREFHVHVCLTGSHDERRHRATRDYLRAHPAEVVRYAALKRDLVRDHAHDRLAYMAGKDQYLGNLEVRALDWARSERFYAD